MKRTGDEELRLMILRLDRNCFCMFLHILVLKSSAVRVERQIALANKEVLLVIPVMVSLRRVSTFTAS